MAATIETREAARERLYNACKMGSIVCAILLVAGLVYGGIAAIVALQYALPQLVETILKTIVPNIDEGTLASAECATRALLLALSGIIGLLMFRKIRRTEQAFRLGQLRQLKFIAFLMMLLGFFPTLVGNLAMVVLAFQQGGSPLSMLMFTFEPMCIVASITLFVAIRALTAGSVLAAQDSELAAAAPEPAASEGVYEGAASYDFVSSDDAAAASSVDFGETDGEDAPVHSIPEI